MNFHLLKNNHLLWQFVGEDPYILATCSTMTKIRFSLIGLIVFLVVSISGISIAFGVYEVLESEIFGWIIGIYSSLFFLVLYIFILNTLNKNVLPTKEAPYLGKIISYVIRIGFLILLGLITYQPIAYALFSGFVNKELTQDISEEIKAQNILLNKKYSEKLVQLAKDNGSMLI